MNKLLATLAIVATAFSVTNAMAAVINASATGLTGATTITFGQNTYANETTLTNQYQSSGITFNSNTFYYNRSGYGFSGSSIQNFTNSNITSAANSSVFFTSTVTAADFNIVTNSGSTVFAAYLSGNLIESFSASTSTSNQTLFYGFQNIAFNEIRINAPSNDALVLDNIQFKASAVPEPTTVALLGLGLLGVVASRRKSAKSKNA